MPFINIYTYIIHSDHNSIHLASDIHLKHQLSCFLLASTTPIHQSIGRTTFAFNTCRVPLSFIPSRVRPAITLDCTIRLPFLSFHLLQCFYTHTTSLLQSCIPCLPRFLSYLTYIYFDSLYLLIKALKNPHAEAEVLMELKQRLHLNAQLMVLFYRFDYEVQ